MNEPLKDKTTYVRAYGWLGSLEKTKKKYPYEMYRTVDLKSAVEWLRERIDNFNSRNCNIKIPHDLINGMIDEAFADVTLKKRKDE